MYAWSREEFVGKYLVAVDAAGRSVFPATCKHLGLLWGESNNAIRQHVFARAITWTGREEF